MRPSSSTHSPRRKKGSLPWLGAMFNLIAVFTLITFFAAAYLMRSIVPREAGRPENRMPVIQYDAAIRTSQSPIKIAHAISLITCQKASRVKGFMDSLIILRHSIHQNSVHAHPNSKYSYQMYAIIHPDGGCTQHVDFLQRLGYITLVKSTPVNISDIRNDWYRNHVEQENCCGSKEFIKLYAYTLLDHPVVVHWDLDVAVLQPMDDLYDAMIYPADSLAGQAARQRLDLQRPESQKVLPTRIDAFLTRDVTSAQPWESVQAVQGGFVVARPSLEHFRMYQDFIMEANYTAGRGPTSGWGGLGYGGFQGAMAYQGVIAYFYDQIYPGHAVELNVCRWNQVVADVIWRGPAHMDHHLQCRQFPLDGDYTANTPANGRCEDCRVLPIEQTKTVHYTACKKPWECTMPYPRIPRMKNQLYRLQELTNVTTCSLLFAKYFAYRRDMEDRIAKALGTTALVPKGIYHAEAFLGYCEGAGNYISMSIPDTFDMKRVYGF